MYLCVHLSIYSCDNVKYPLHRTVRIHLKITKKWFCNFSKFFPLFYTRVHWTPVTTLYYLRLSVPSKRITSVEVKVYGICVIWELFANKSKLFSEFKMYSHSPLVFVFYHITSRLRSSGVEKTVYTEELERLYKIFT